MPAASHRDVIALLDGAAVVAVAASGGADSAAALLRVRECAPRAEIIACYVDHGVRPRRSIDRDIAALCAQAEAASARVLVARLRGMPPGERSEATLRRARYAVLRVMAQHVGASVVVTGHHAGDIAEWVLLALLRGSGLDGLRAMAPDLALAHGVRLVRPFLGETREKMAAVVKRYGVRISEDETNADERYRRNIVRAFLARWPGEAHGAVRALARSARLASEERGLLDAIASSLAERARAADGAIDLRALREEPAPMLRRIIRDAVRRAAGSARDFSFAQCDAIARAIRERRGGEYRAGRAYVVLSAGLLRVRARRLPEGDGFGRPKADHKGPPHNGGPPHIGGPAHIVSVELRAAAVPDGARLSVRLPQSGDRCTPSGRRRSVSLARFFAKQGIPRDRRTSVPLLCVNGEIAAALGVRVMEPFAVHGDDSAVRVAWRRANLSAPPGPTDSITMERSTA